MAEERDPNVSQRYRELGGAQPPPAVDQAILGAARQAVAPRRRWYLPLAAAAVLVLAVGVALQVHREQPEPQPTAPPSVVEQEKARVPAPELRTERKREEQNAARDSAAGVQTRPQEERRPAPAAAPPIPQAVEGPEEWLERIAHLRQLGRNEEADRALAEFRQRYPDYRISEEMLGKIRK
jgi:hypothetical protein